MWNYLGNKLNRAIRDRASAAGLVKSKTAEIERLRAALDEAVVELEAAQAATSRWDAEITAISAIGLPKCVPGSPPPAKDALSSSFHSPHTCEDNGVLGNNMLLASLRPVRG